MRQRILQSYNQVKRLLEAFFYSADLTLKKSPERGSHPDCNDEIECSGGLVTHGIFFPVQQQQQQQQHQQ